MTDTQLAKYINTLTATEKQLRKDYDDRKKRADASLSLATQFADELAEATAKVKGLTSGLLDGDQSITTRSLADATADASRLALLHKGHVSRSDAGTPPVVPDLAGRLCDLLQGIYGDAVTIVATTQAPPVPTAGALPIIVVTQARRAKHDTSSGYVSSDGPIEVRYARSPLMAQLDVDRLIEAGRQEGMRLTGGVGTREHPGGVLVDLAQIAVREAAPTEPPLLAKAGSPEAFGFYARIANLSPLQRWAKSLRGCRLTDVDLSLTNYATEGEDWTGIVRLTARVVRSAAINEGGRMDTCKITEPIRQGVSAFRASILEGELLEHVGLISKATGGVKLDEAYETETVVTIALDLTVQARIENNGDEDLDDDGLDKLTDRERRELGLSGAPIALAKLDAIADGIPLG